MLDKEERITLQVEGFQALIIKVLKIFRCVFNSDSQHFVLLNSMKIIFSHYPGNSTHKHVSKLNFSFLFLLPLRHKRHCHHKQSKSY